MTDERLIEDVVSGLSPRLDRDLRTRTIPSWLLGRDVDHRPARAPGGAGSRQHNVASLAIVKQVGSL